MSPRMRLHEGGTPRPRPGCDCLTSLNTIPGGDHAVEVALACRYGADGHARNPHPAGAAESGMAPNVVGTRLATLSQLAVLASAPVDSAGSGLSGVTSGLTSNAGANAGNCGAALLRNRLAAPLAILEAFATRHLRPGPRYGIANTVFDLILDRRIGCPAISHSSAPRRYGSGHPSSSCRSMARRFALSAQFEIFARNGRQALVAEPRHGQFLVQRLLQQRNGVAETAGFTDGDQ